MPDIITNDKIILRVAIPDDAQNLHNLFEKNRDFFEHHDEDINVFQNAEKAQKFLTAIQNSPHQKYYLILIDDTLIGILNVWNYDAENHTCELGYYLAHSATGHGIMTIAINIICDKLFKNSMSEIKIQTAKTNIASRALAMRCGFEHVATIKDAWDLPRQNIKTDTFIFIKTNK